MPFNKGRQAVAEQLPEESYAPQARLLALVDIASSGALRLEISPDAGRFLVANKRVEAGAELWHDDVYAQVPHEQDACNFCMASVASECCEVCLSRFCVACRDKASCVHAAECLALAAIKSAVKNLVTSQQHARLAIRTLAHRAANGAPQEGKTHWTDVVTSVAHAKTVAALPSKLWANMKSDGELLFTLLPPSVAMDIKPLDITLLLLRIKYNAATIGHIDNGGYTPVASTCKSLVTPVVSVSKCLA